ncbi:MAG: right-handed parallel beta-helix repeat-containing protein [Planctomycetes bacterium]|nr:right-handed parallel beta-helix repeat-containing protein [Planctomycetota bacterium]
MKLVDVKLVIIFLVGCVLVPGSVFSMTIQFGSGGTELIAPGDTWQFFRGNKAPSDPADAWYQIDFNDLDWETGDSGFGYGDSDDETKLDDMQYNYVTVYIRKEFSVSSLPGDEMVELVIDYDDGFIAYLNGDEVKRRHVTDDPATYETTASSHEAGTPETFVLGTVGDLLNGGNNVLAIEGHNVSLTSSDFSLIPALRTSSDAVKNGETWIVETQMVSLSGSTDAPEAVSVVIGGTAADFNSVDGTWEGEVLLAPGLNTVIVEALDGGAGVVDSGSIEMIYVAAGNHVSGALTENTAWCGAVILEDTVVVETGIVLNIEAGTVVMMKEAAGLIVNGQLLADGTESEPIRFTHYGDGTTWERIMFIEAEDSRLAHCIIEYSDCEGKHQDYYNPGPRDYREAIVVLASHLDFEGCIFHNLPDDSGDGEGDALAIISDDPDYPGEASAHIIGCQFLSIGQGVHTRFSYILVENCYFTGKNGDNDDVDLWGESTPPPLILNNLFLNPNDDDMINPTKCSAIIIGNVIIGSRDHCVVLRDKSFPIMINNLISNCRNAGVAIENTCKALLINNTITDIYGGGSAGIKIFDLGRASHPYYLTKGGGVATLINCIVSDCQTAIRVTDSSQLDNEPNAGSHVAVLYSNIEGGSDGVAIVSNGTVLDSTITWLEGNIDEDPQFADSGSRDYHLKSLVGRWNPNSQAWVTDASTSLCIDAGTSYVVDDPNYLYCGLIDWRGELWPHGGLINMGAYGGTPQASMSRDAEKGNAADIDYDGSVGLSDFGRLAQKWRIEKELLAEDLDRNGVVDFSDVMLMGWQWLWQEQE